MKLKTPDLLNAISSLAPIARAKSFLPITQCVKLVSGNHLVMTVFNGDEFMARKIEYEGEIMTACVRLEHLLNSIGSDPETTIINKDGTIVVKCGSKIGRLPTVDVKEFPDLPDTSKFKAIGVPTADLAAGIRAVHGFEHKERMPLTNVHIVGTAKSIQCDACDGLQLISHKQLLISADFEILVPAQFCNSLTNALEEDEAIMSISENQIHVESKLGEYFCKQGEGKWPSVRAFETEFKPIGIIDADAVSDELAKFLNYREQDKAPMVMAEFTEKELVLSFNGSGSQLENRFAGEFKPAKCATNGESFLKCLKPFKGNVTVFDAEPMLKFSSCEKEVFMGKMRNDCA